MKRGAPNRVRLTLMYSPLPRFGEEFEGSDQCPFLSF